MSEVTLNDYDLHVVGNYVSTLEPKDPLIRLGELEEQIKTLEAQHAKALKQAKQSDITAFNCFKADVIVLLKAIELVAIASQRHGEIALNHHVRDMRLEHLQGIIGNAINDFGDRSLVHYEDDF